jgi:hypothetical protein
VVGFQKQHQHQHQHDSGKRNGRRSSCSRCLLASIVAIEEAAGGAGKGAIHFDPEATAESSKVTNQVEGDGAGPSRKNINKIKRMKYPVAQGSGEVEDSEGGCEGGEEDKAESQKSSRQGHGGGREGGG